MDNNKLRKKKEIRLHDVCLITIDNKKIYIKHPAYIFLENDNVYIYVTITHSRNVKGFLTIKLRKNPNPKDKKESYWVAEIRQDTKNAFTKVKSDWSVDELDDKDIRGFFDEQKTDDSAIR